MRTDENFALYRKYLGSRHPGGGMDDPSPADFDAFLSCEWSNSEFFEWRLDGSLIALAVTDVLGDSLSAVYTCFDPEQADRSLGTLAILAQIEQARLRGLPHLYLGFWLDGHRKMDYKKSFRPLEFLAGSQWRLFES